MRHQEDTYLDTYKPEHQAAITLFYLEAWLSFKSRGSKLYPYLIHAGKHPVASLLPFALLLSTYNNFEFMFLHACNFGKFLTVFRYVVTPPLH